MSSNVPIITAKARKADTTFGSHIFFLNLDYISNKLKSVSSIMVRITNLANNYLKPQCPRDYPINKSGRPSIIMYLYLCCRNGKPKPRLIQKWTGSKIGSNQMRWQLLRNRLHFRPSAILWILPGLSYSWDTNHLHLLREPLFLGLHILHCRIHFNIVSTK